MAAGDPWYVQAFALLEAHKDGATILVALLSATVALVATIVGPWISARIAKKQIVAALETARKQTATALHVARLDFNATVVSTNRQKWIDNLRDALAELVALLRVIAADYRAERRPINETLPLVKRMLELSDKVELFLNPEEKEHVEFVEQLQEMRRACMDRQLPAPGLGRQVDDAELIDALADDLLDRAKKILKAEWKRVKAGEPERKHQREEKAS